ncbi:histidine phosphatase family protein [Prolixibacter denitrificans]|uniref:Phosphoglycerate mutase n=1 Tax=Prolixibacter denitrificans TaxID=1541063 RepID=A0A2P8CDX6_9BACT|nr:histidine phosphatase family protein [Prolixibacter denitrificans]PSK83184.1 putative phosphoglycerate mutase [Prolixibacter denitrificans]GET21933.1 phosphoglycerate mutase [Prolixibacter denitrificans]
MIDFWLIRHGETVENAQGICQGQTPGTLSEDGMMQARALAEYLKNEEFDVIYSSDLRRTMKTTEAVLQFHPGEEIIPEPLLRERYLADWQGKPFPKNWKEMDLPEEAETSEDLIVRAKAFLSLLKEKHEGKKVFAMSHGGLIRAFWTVLHNLDNGSYSRWDAPENTSISRFGLNEDGSVNELVRNLAEHLETVPVSSKAKNKNDWQL